MSLSLPAVGTFALLETLSAFVPDDFINARWPSPTRRRGPRLRFSAAQLGRAHLLGCLGGGRAFNAVQRALAEQRALRRFAHLPNERSVPDVRRLHEFRARLGPGGFRAIHDHRAREILWIAPLREKSVALLDATDLPARAGDKKRRSPNLVRVESQPRRPFSQTRPYPFLCRLQIAHAATLDQRF